MILDVILVKYSEFTCYSNKIKSLGLFLNKNSSEMKYIVQNSTEILRLEFFIFEKFIDFFFSKNT